MSPNDPLIDALRPITSRVRRDKTAYKRADGKAAWTGSEKTGPAVPLTRARMAQHLNGGPACGVCPLPEGGDKVGLAVLDFDSHKGEVPWVEMSSVVTRVADALTLAWGCEVSLFRSGGGSGAHLYIFWPAMDQDAYSVRQWLFEVLAGCGLKNGTGGVIKGQVEVFPKQDRVEIGDSGSQFFLPMAGRGAPLVLDDLSGMLVDQPREWLLSSKWWGLSPAVEVRERPVRAARKAGEVTEYAVIEECLQVIGDAVRAGKASNARDSWRDRVFEVNAATMGSEEGRAIAHAYSASVPDYEESEVDKIWDNADPSKPGARGLGSLKWEARRWGWVDPEGLPDPDDFGVLEGWDEVSGHSLNPDVAGAELTRRSVPAAQHLCTDQANANRIVKAYGSRVMVSAGRWHVWDGLRWRADESDVYRYACRLSDMVREEAGRVRAAAAERGEVPESVEIGPRGGKKVVLSESEELAQSLEAWGRQSEMRTTIEAAVGLARKMLTVDEAMLDRDPWALNTLSGVVDLRTGALRPHKASDFITKLAPVAYRPGPAPGGVEGVGGPGGGVSVQVCEAWERAVAQIAEDGSVAAFLQRWFGYCATGLTREQVFVVHWGDGSNGKSTVLDTVARALGDYAGTAAPGLVAGGEKDRHPTEIAALMGKRMVTAHETREGVQLREDFVKQATGGDRLVGRFMREDFFEFDPTHKLQLLTNSKPVVKGQDHGIWRRVRLVRYGVRFGSVEDVREGRAGAVRDLGLAAALGSGEALAGVLAWVVRGAVAWADGGLQAPRAVLEAGEAYRAEQDRVRQWALECCDTGEGAGLPLTVWEPLTAGMGGLFPSYTGWCKESGYHALGRQRFLEELERAFPRIKTAKGNAPGESGGRRSVLRVCGIRLLPE